LSKYRAPFTLFIRSRFRHTIRCRTRQGRWIINDISVAHDLDTIPIKLDFLIADIEAAAIDILAYEFKSLLYYLVNLFGVQARNLKIFHSIRLSICLGI
jgi:hypothetical protein